MLNIFNYLLLTIWPFSFDLDSKKEITDLIDASSAYYISDPDSNKLLVNTALVKSREINYKYGEARCLYILGLVASHENQPDKAVPNLLEALELFRTINNEKYLSDQAGICLALGKVFRSHHNISTALDFYEQGVSLAISAKNNSTLRQLLYNKSIAYRRQGSLVKAMESLVKSMDLIPDENKIIKQRTYNQFGLIYLELEKFETSREWFRKMIQLESNNSDPQFYRGQAYHNIALTYKGQNNNERAWEFFTKAASEKEQLGNAEKLFITYHDMAELAASWNREKLALKYAQKALNEIKQVPNTPEFYNIYKLLAQGFANKNSSIAMSYASQYMNSSEAFNAKQKLLIENGDKYKVQLIASNYFNKVKRQKERIRMAWTMSCAAAFVFLAFALGIRLYRIYSYKSPELALTNIKSQNEMIYLMDMFRNEKEEMKKTLRQLKK